MFKFENSIYFYAFSTIPLLVFLFLSYLHQRKKKLKLLGDERLVKELSPYSNLRKRISKHFLFILAIRRS